MKTFIAALLVACGTAAVVAGFFLACGFDFNERGHLAGCCYGASLILSVWSFGTTMMFLNKSA